MGIDGTGQGAGQAGPPARLPAMRGPDHEARAAGSSVEHGGDLHGARRVRRRCSRIFVTTGGSVMNERIRICFPQLQSSSEMKIVSFIMDPPVIKKILEHLAKKKGTRGRAPPRRVPSEV